MSLVDTGRYLLEMRLVLCLAGGPLNATRNNTRSYIQVLSLLCFVFKGAEHRFINMTE